MSLQCNIRTSRAVDVYSNGIFAESWIAGRGLTGQRLCRDVSRPIDSSGSPVSQWPVTLRMRAQHEG